MAENLKFGAFVILLFVLLLLLFKKNKAKPDWLLLCWCVLFAVHLITINFYDLLPQAWFYLNEVISFLHGFILYHYIGLNLKEPISTKAVLLQLLPLVLGILLVLTLSGNYYWENPWVLLLSKSIVSGIYIAAIFIKFFRQKIPQRNWYLFLTISLTILILLPLLSAGYDYNLFITNQNLLGNTAYCFFILLLGFFGIGIEPVFVNKYEAANELEIPKYATSNLTTIQRTEIFEHLEKLVTAEKLYTYTDLNIGMVAKRLGHNANRVSESINAIANCNFNDYINQKRIAAFKTKIEQGEHQQKTLLSLAFECGFNSKTSFNRAFKKLTDLTPTQYIRSKS